MRVSFLQPNVWRNSYNRLTTLTSQGGDILSACLTYTTPRVRLYRTMAKPKLIVFDLDYTLWPFWVDTHVDPPFKTDKDGKVHDRRGRHIKHYGDVPDILSSLHADGFKIGIASRTSATKEAEELTRLFNWDHYFHYRQIYPDCKITHFKKLHELSKIPYQDMLFFDDEHRNIKDVSSLGVTCMFVPDDGVNHDSLKKGFDLFKKNNSQRDQNSS